MTATDPAGCIQHYPMSMGRFGENPFGENRFRLVLASSRRNLIFGQWNESGAPRAKFCQTYPHIPAGLYVIEEWVDAFTFTGMTAARWNSDSNVNILGPYPSRGEYVMVGNCGFNPAEFNIEKLINLVHASDRYTWAEKLAACKDTAARDEAERSSLREAIIRDALPAFGHAPFSQVSTGRGGAGKTSPVRYAAQDVGLPAPAGIPGQATFGPQVVPKQLEAA